MHSSGRKPTSAIITRGADPKHGRVIPSGLAMARLLREFYRKQATDAARQLRADPFASIHLGNWIPEMIQKFLPLSQRLYSRGGKQAQQRIQAALQHRGRPVRILRLRRSIGRRAFALPLHKDRRLDEIILPAWDIFRPEVYEAIWSATFAFCQATLDTATRDLETAMVDLRATLSQGLGRGETVAQINARVGRIFKDPFRAARVAQTESSRAMHAGQALAAQESGVCSGLRWMASSDACKLCLPLDGKEVPFGTAFFVDSKGGPYARVEHAPRHPFLHVYRQ